MNENIRKLISQSFTGCQGEQFDPEKFALMIIQTCAEVVTDAVDHREPASTYADKIKQHFGIEQ
jgi:hypothetical protein